MITIKRDVEQALVEWKDNPMRMPLLLRGARQVGKSFLVEQFALTHFNDYLCINFEESPEYISCFTSMKITEIINQIEVVAEKKIVPQKTLLFLDEIQVCPRAIASLRYFKEKLPELHVIAAGSLLEFALEQGQFSMPVGRIQYMYLYPLSFFEFLRATGNQQLVDYLKNINVNDQIPDSIHQKALTLVSEYMVIGGMPQVVVSYLMSKKFLDCQRIQSALIKTYSDDFSKYAKTAQFPYLKQTLEKTPLLVGQQIKYVNISDSMDSRGLKKAIEQLKKANVIHPVSCTSMANIPFENNKKENKFKLLFLDIGLMNRLSKLDATVLLNPQALLSTRGSLAEQFVGQELLVMNDPYENEDLYYWARDEKNSSAEIDYLVQFNSNIIPIEVKSGKTGTLKSLKMIMQDYHLPIGIKISAQELGIQNIDGRIIISIPFYLISQIEKFIQTIGTPLV